MKCINYGAQNNTTPTDEEILDAWDATGEASSGEVIDADQK